MIDKAYQRKGYGRSAMAVCLDYLRSNSVGKAEKCWLDCEPDNVAAQKLYESFGFRKNGEVCDDADVYVLDL